MKVHYIISEKSDIVAMALWPFIIANKKYLIKGISLQVVNHEKIHHRQQLELLILPFYIWYSVEWIIKWIRYRDIKKAYQAISFEQEAYDKECNLNYLKHRKRWMFVNYL